MWMSPLEVTFQANPARIISRRRTPGGDGAAHTQIFLDLSVVCGEGINDCGYVCRTASQTLCWTSGSHLLIPAARQALMDFPHMAIVLPAKF